MDDRQYQDLMERLRLMSGVLEQISLTLMEISHNMKSEEGAPATEPRYFETDRKW